VRDRARGLRADEQHRQAARKAAELKPYADYEALASARIETVRGLAAARFDWEQALRDLSRAVPSEVKLQTLSGDMGLPGTDGSGGGDPLRKAIQAPAITVTGCAPSQPAVAAMMARLRGVDGVTRVSLSKSEKSASTGPTPAGGEAATPCGSKSPPSFSAVVFFEGSAALQNLAQESAAAAPASVPVPDAVAGEQQDAAATGEDGASGDAGAGEPTTTSTTPGSTP
jgi:hypothetical protein